MTKQTKVSLIRHNSGIPATEYEVSKIIGAIVVIAGIKDVRAGNRISEKDAQQLAEAYEVTVTPFKP